MRKQRFKKVFLLADIGKYENNGIHIGDEVMFLANVIQYKKLGFNVFASSRSISHNNKLFFESLDIYITSFNQYKSLVKLIKTININKNPGYPADFWKTIKNLINCDLLHISGGGNINELWPGHIYYRCLMIKIAKYFKIPVIFTSQTISLISSNSYKKILRECFDYASFIGVRDLQDSKVNILKTGSTNKNILTMIDDAYYLNHKYRIKNKDKIILGISIHKWDKSRYSTNKIVKIITNTAKSLSIDQLLFIPQLIYPRVDLGDSKYIIEILKSINYDSRIIKYNDIFNYGEIGYEWIPKLLKIYNSLSYSICSRYHGLVFSYMYKIPTLVISHDQYYDQKLNGFIKLFITKQSFKNFNYPTFGKHKIKLYQILNKYVYKN